MAITPQTNLKLLKSTLSLDNMNQLKFASATAQYNYFKGLTKLEASNFTYQRKDNVIRYPAHIDSLMEYDYCMYQNSNYTNKWFYAYIVRMEYVNDNMTNIYIKTDPYQTWQFDLTFKRSFVEREHVNNDTIGLHTVPEDLETGDYVVIDSDTLNVFGSTYSDYNIILAVTKEPGTTAVPGENVGGNMYGGVFSGVEYITGRNFSSVINIIKSYNDSGGMESITSIFLAPKTISTPDSWITVVGWQYNVEYGVVPAETEPFGYTLNSLTKPSSLDGSYTPVNKKLLTYPFTYVNVDNNVGNTATFKFEDFTDNVLNKITFNIDGTIVPGCSYKLTPANYKGQTTNYLYSMNLAKLPICSWQSDVYTNWLTQNSINTGVSLAGSLMSTTIGVSTGNPIATASGILGVAQSIGSIHEHSLIPPQVNGNLNGADISFTLGLSNPIAYTMSIKQEYAQIIDGFFSMYGYKVNTTKVPNITGRRNWNYVKTIDCNIEGYIPQEDLAEIKGMFNNGVTIWHNPSTFLDYSQNNDII